MRDKTKQDKSEDQIKLYLPRMMYKVNDSEGEHTTIVIKNFVVLNNFWSFQIINNADVN